METVEALVIKESYGLQTAQHTFTLQRPDGSKFRIKGRNLYANGVYRKLWRDESARKLVADEKHERGRANKDRVKEERAFISGNF